MPSLQSFKKQRVVSLCYAQNDKSYRYAPLLGTKMVHYDDLGASAYH